MKMRIFLSVILLLSLFFICSNFTVAATVSPKKIAILANSKTTSAYISTVKSEIEALLKGREAVEFEEHVISNFQRDEAEDLLSGLMSDNDISIVISLSFGMSEALISLKEYQKPAIAAMILDANMQGLRITEEGTSGIKNFNFIVSPFDIHRDLKTFRTLYDYKHLGVLYNSHELSMFHSIYNYLGKVVNDVAPEARMSIVEINEDDLRQSLTSLPPEVDAVYLPLVFTEDSDGVQQKLIKLLNEKKLPTFALQGEKIVRLGALASIAPERNITSLTRRLAINVLNILSGMDAGDQKVQISSYTDNFVVNVGTMRKIGCYPGWESLHDAYLVEVSTEVEGARSNLKNVILESLEANLDLAISKMDTALQGEEVGISRAPLFPQVAVSGYVNVLDKNRANGELGSLAPASLNAGADMSQILYSDDVFANYQIQKILSETAEYEQETQLLDTVVTAAQAYIQVLFAQSNQTIINDNLSVTRKNLDIARNKEAVGSVGASDVYRWENEVAQNQISLNDSYRDLQIAKMELNQVLNRKVTDPFIIDDVISDNPIELMVTDPQVYHYLSNLDRTTRFAHFLEQEADRNLPELEKASAIVRYRERTVLNSRRDYYLPDVNLVGEVDKVLEEYDTDYATSSDLDHPWTVAATASWTLFNGLQRKHELAMNKIEARKARLQEADLRNKLHLQVRSNLETAAVSARRVDLSVKSAVAAQKNLEIVQAAYAEGKNSITDLIDAQNTKVAAVQGEMTAKYQFVLDFLLLERATGKYYFLQTAEEKQSFIARLGKFMGE